MCRAAFTARYGPVSDALLDTLVATRLDDWLPGIIIVHRAPCLTRSWTRWSQHGWMIDCLES